MSEYPRDLLISEDVIRNFEEIVGVRFINKTECAKALAEHDAKVKADAIKECIEVLKGIDTYVADMVEDIFKLQEEYKEQKNDSKRVN